MTDREPPTSSSGRAPELTGGETNARQLRVDVIRDFDELTALKHQWDRLTDIAGNAGTYTTHAGVLAWYTFLEGRDGVYVVTVWRDRELVGIAPFSVTQVGLPPVHFRLFTSPRGEPLMRSDAEGVSTVLADHIRGLVAPGRAAVKLHRVAVGGPLSTILRRQGGTVYERSYTRVHSVIRFDQIADTDSYFDHLSRRYQIPKKTRRLMRRYEKVEHRPSEDEPDAALDDMRDMLMRRFGPSAGPKLFSSPEREAFTRAVVHDLAASGRSRVSSIAVDGRRVAVSLGFHLGETYIDYATAREPSLEYFSVGHLQRYDWLRAVHASGTTTVDLGGAEYTHKDDWANAASEYEGIGITASGRRGQLARVLRRGAMRRRGRHPRRLSR